MLPVQLEVGGGGFRCGAAIFFSEVVVGGEMEEILRMVREPQMGDGGVEGVGGGFGEGGGGGAE